LTTIIFSKKLKKSIIFARVEITMATRVETGKPECIINQCWTGMASWNSEMKHRDTFLIYV
jgi:hypothetical protein